MRFRSYDHLRIFEVVARHGGFTAAARELNLTKGAVSYQIGRLEDELGFEVFAREHRRIELTAKGTELLPACKVAFYNVEREIARLREDDRGYVTVGMSTYFASRWLSPRLMTFLTEHPRTGLRLQPLVDLIDLEGANIDMAIRWGKGDWADMKIERLFTCPTFPTAGRAIARLVDDLGLEAALNHSTLLHDRDGSEAWLDWHKAVGAPYRAGQDALVIPDPNVRVQAVINGQGVALNDSLVANELSAGELCMISDVRLSTYGYFLTYPDGALEDLSLCAFRDWIMSEAEAEAEAESAGAG